MASKKVSFGTKPQKQPDVNAWVESRESPENISTKEPEAVIESAIKSKAKAKAREPEKSADQNAMKRLTLDIPENLHKRIKGKAVMEGVTMVNMLRELLEETYE